MPAAKGHKRYGGREKGSLNKTTRGCKENILEVFEKIGGVQNFAAWAMENQTEFYRHYAKLLPVELNASVKGQIIIKASKHDEEI